MHHHFASDADSLRAFKELLVSQVKAKHDFYSVLDLLISVRPEFAESPERVRILLDLLRSLREEGILDFPALKALIKIMDQSRYHDGFALSRQISSDRKCASQLKFLGFQNLPSLASSLIASKSKLR